MITSDLMQAALDLLGKLLIVVVPIIVARVGTWARTQWANIEAKMPENIRKAINDAAEFGADFAHQVNLAGLLDQYAQSKKEAAMKAAQDYLKELGYENVSLDVLSNAIEVILKRNAESYETKPKTSEIKVGF